MRKTKAIALLLVMLAATVGALAGCGGTNNPQAKAMTQAADATLNGLAPGAYHLLEQMEELNSDYSSGVNTEQFGVDQQLDEITAASDQLGRQLQTAEQQYRAVLQVHGAGDYATYANQRLYMVGRLANARTAIGACVEDLRYVADTGEAPDAALLDGTTHRLLLLAGYLKERQGQAHEFAATHHLFDK